MQGRRPPAVLTLRVSPKNLLVVVSSAALFCLLRVLITERIPNPFIPGGVIALEMVIPIIVAILFGAGTGAATGLLGPGLTYLATLGAQGFSERAFLLVSVGPLACSAFLAGRTAQHFPLPVSALFVALAHLLNIVLFYLLGLRGAPELFNPSVAFGLAGETMTDMLLICLVCELWTSPQEALGPKLGKQSVPLLCLAAVGLAYSAVFASRWSAGSSTDGLFVCYFVILLSIMSYGSAAGFLAAIISALEAIHISLVAVNPGVQSTTFLHSFLFGTMALLSSELVRAREKVNQLELENQFMKEREQFMDSMVHEVKSPLTAILSSAGLLAEEVKDKLLARAVANIKQSAEDLDGRLTDLLEATTTENKEYKLDRRNIDPAEFLDRAISSASPLFSAKVQELTTEISPLPQIEGDPRRLAQAVFNILENASKYTPPGGSIAVRAYQEGRDVVVEIQDTGPGIPEAELERIFAPYARLERANGVAGFGLGLFLARKVVEAHGGRIRAESHPGGGTRFTLFLPAEARGEHSDH